MTFNIRKLKIQIECTKRELQRCDPRSRDRLRLKLKSQELALRLAKEARALQRVAA
jgi:hypothetical protein